MWRRKNGRLQNCSISESLERPESNDATDICVPLHAESDDPFTLAKFSCFMP